MAKPKRKRPDKCKVSNAESCKKWRDINPNRVKLYKNQKKIERLRLEKDNPEAAKEKRAFLAKQRKDQRNRKKNKDKEVASGVFPQAEEVESVDAEDEENEPSTSNSKKTRTVRTKFNFQTPNRRRNEEKEDSDTDLSFNEAIYENVKNGDTRNPSVETGGKNIKSRKRSHSDDSQVTVGLGSGKLQAKQPKLSRQAQVGLKMRRNNLVNKETELKEKSSQLKEANSKIKDLEKRLQGSDLKNLELEKENSELKEVNSDMKAKKEEDEIWIKTTFKNMPKSGRQMFKDSVINSRENLPKGTFLKVRRILGINLHQMPTIHEKEESELAVLVKEFAEFNSDPVPYTKTCSGVDGIPDKRFALHFKNVLFEHFKAQYPDKNCSYSQFCRYWPSHVVKPNLDSRGTCKCELCENSLKRWVTLKITDPTGKTKVQAERRTQYVKVKNLANQALEDFASLKDHLERNAKIKQYIADKRNFVKESEDQAMIYIDWSESGTFKQPGETQSAWFSKKQYSILTGYQYWKLDSHGFAALSMYTNHMAECHFVALQPTLSELAEKGIKKLIIVSDSPISEFRNMKNCWLMREWSKEYGIEVEWIFTEKSHGKSVADGIGGGVKSKHAQLTSFDTSLTINNVEDLARVLAPHTSTKLSIYTKEKVDEFRQWLPSKLNSLTGALKIHHLSFTTDGQVMSRLLPQDAVGTRVNIKPGFGPLARRTTTPRITIHPQEGEEEEEADMPGNNSAEE